ncbi:hypothetical protein ACL7TT_11340 [Microbulbifer sp. 2304DJ12-6]|uniref:hypothetical protein n=1 Tax=Microbulbifer sp. 2304DJ12-6 TaxID=3233340 RepID=UPI0039AFEE13
MPGRTWKILGLWLEALQEAGFAETWAGPLFRGVDRWGNISSRRISADTIYYGVRKRTTQAGLDRTSPQLCHLFAE